MKFFQKMQSEKLWNSVEFGWKTALKLDVFGLSIGEFKPK